MAQYWQQPLPPFHIASAAAYANSVTLSDVSPLPHKSFPANYLVIGTELEITAWGQFSTTGTPTLLLGFYYGAVAGVALAATAATTTGSGAAAWPWSMVYYGKVRTIGTTGTITGQGVLQLGTSLTASTAVALPATAAARTVTIDTTTLKNITVGAQWGTQSVSNTLTCDDFSVKIIN